MANFLANSQAEQASRRQNGEDIQLIDPLSSPPLQGTTRGKSKSGFPGSSTASTRLDSPNPVLNSPSPDRARPPESDAGAAPGAGVVGNDFDLFSWQDGLYGSGGSSINTVSGRGGGPGALNAGVSGIGAHQSEASGSRAGPTRSTRSWASTRLCLALVSASSATAAGTSSGAS